MKYEAEKIEATTMMMNMAAPSEEEELVVVPHNEVDSLAPTSFVLPYSIHASHRILFCGGFVVCDSCASMASTASGSNLAGKCKGKEHRNSGSMSRLKRIQNGQHPRPEKAKATGKWPDGERWALSLPPRPVHRVQHRSGTGTGPTTVCALYSKWACTDLSR